MSGDNKKRGPGRPPGSKNKTALVRLDKAAAAIVPQITALKAEMHRSARRSPACVASPPPRASASSTRRRATSSRPASKAGSTSALLLLLPVPMIRSRGARPPSTARRSRPGRPTLNAKRTVSA